MNKPCSCNNRKYCATNMDRRNFLKVAGAGAAALSPLGSALPVMAGPFEENEYLKIIPHDKRLHPDWVQSLFERGRKEAYSDPKALAHIGMPIGGLFAGTVYLGGDGRLWLWDIFNRDQEGIVPREVQYKGEQVNTRGGANYIEPAKPFSPFEQGFGLRIGQKNAPKDIPLNLQGFKKVTFQGEYPRAIVRYEDSSAPVTAQLEAFSPFVPLSVEASSLPATVLRYTIKNTGSETLNLEIYGYLQNPVCLDSHSRVSGRLCNRITQEKGFTALVCSAEPIKAESIAAQPDLLFDDFEKTTYKGWTVEGSAFGKGPVRMADIPDYQGDVHGIGERVVNSHASAPGQNVGEKDGHTGILTSSPFTIQRKYITFLIGGGAHKELTCVNLLINDKIIGSVTGKNNNRMERTIFDVQKYNGQTARLQIVDNYGQGWGNIGVDEIVFTDRKPDIAKLETQPDFGTMALSLVGSASEDYGTAQRNSTQCTMEAVGEFTERPMGEIGRSLRLEPDQETAVSFLVTWHFPNFYGRDLDRLVGHSYAARFASALDVTRYVARKFDTIVQQTRNWVETWYDSTLPYWLLDRTMANTSTLATTTCYRFKDGQFWAWEGIGCCGGTCTHVWHYAQAPGRLFPEIERNHREQVDFGIALDEEGGIGHRMWLDRRSHPAHDGQCGRILGAYREHLMSADTAFLTRNWPNIKKAILYLIHLDKNEDGLIEGAQPNTLDAAWYGKISFLASLYLAALQAGEAMAIEMGDSAFAKQCNKIAQQGAKIILELFNGEYFIQIEDPTHKGEIGIGPGCYIDQIFGQSWAHQVGLGRLFDREAQCHALQALWKYNFVPDVGPFREQFTRGRWYAMAGDAGLLMCTWPRGGQNPNFKNHWQYMYFNECMSGFEWQVAAHMISEGMIKEGLAVSRAIHDRYNGALRNPYNEIECSDHYARAMASYGVFISICGYEYHGPKGHMGFAPRLRPEDFRAAFVAAQGWGLFTQKREPTRQTEHIELRYGTLRLASLSFVIQDKVRVAAVIVRTEKSQLPATFKQQGAKVDLKLSESVILATHESIQVEITLAS